MVGDSEVGLVVVGVALGAPNATLGAWVVGLAVVGDAVVGLSVFGPGVLGLKVVGL